MPDAAPGSKVLNSLPRRWSSVRGRLILLLALIPLLAATTGLYKAMPPSDLQARFDGRRPSVYWGGQQPQRHSTIDEDPISVMNLDTGVIRSSTRDELSWNGGVNTRGERVRIEPPESSNQSLPNNAIGNSNASPKSYCAYFKNVETGESRSIEFDWPDVEPELVNGRYVVGRDSNRIYAVDLEHAQQQVFSIASPYSGAFMTAKSIYGTDMLFEIHLPNQPNSAVHKLELFKLSEGQLQLIKTLEIGCFGITRFNGQMLTLSRDGRCVEFRAFEDLELIRALEISDQFLATHQVLDLQRNLLLGSDKTTSEFNYYDILSGELLELPSKNMNFRGSPREGRFLCFESAVGQRRKYARIYDLQERRVCVTVPYRWRELAFLEDGRFAVMHPAYGVSTVVYDLQSGKSIRQTPFQWCAYALVAILLAWGTWVITWLLVSAREDSWLWFDFSIIFVLVPGILAYFQVGRLFPSLGMWGCSTNFAILIGIFIGLLTTCMQLFVLNSDRRSLTILPATLIFAVMNWWLGSVASQPNTGGYSNCVRVSLDITINIALIFVVSQSIRLARVRLDCPLREKPTNGARLSLLDLFIYIACASVIVAASKELFISFPKIAPQFLMNRYWMPATMTATGFAFAMTLAILNRRGWVFRLGCMLAAVLWCTLIAIEVNSFAGYPSQLFTIEASALKIIIMAAIASFVSALALRLRDYLLTRDLAQLS